MEKMSKSHEDYLEAIVMLGGTDEVSVRSVDIAKKLEVSKASVNKAVSLLKEKGLADQPYYGDVTLTHEGYEYGRSVLERHHLLFAFLTQVLGIDDERADAEACLMEHAISDESFEKWRAYFKKHGLKAEI
ncbi:MAG: metal-dependent transcriptional regulator [Berryella intestinalis]|uniref:metal-dependent transcriptional regulator n=1 Tax=Berryella intestinalis TaxID=1531429 RepID=UPI002A53BEA2|nr:metal-dependent transcriptional regulator [Berryella intestinalis]MDD7369615.1 metal-dependent transcriptional regulator [Berryella intestinalis]MDY3128654.1 metal-dependent transcriptional regulator [Berryella intestinalis]